MVSRSTGVVFGGKAIELAGRVIRPDYQEHGIGSYLLREYVASNQPALLTTYTRNPAVIAMLQRVSSEVYPVHDDEHLSQLAAGMTNATLRGDAVYHLNRYDEGGLFGGSDPADRMLHGDSISLKARFTGLINVRNALVIAARVQEEAS